MANEQNLLISMKKPGFSVKVLRVFNKEMTPDAGILSRMIFGEKNPYSESYSYFLLSFLSDHNLQLLITEPER